MKGKKKIWGIIVAAFMMLMLSATVLATPVSEHGRLSVKGTNLVDSKGKKFQLKGVSTHGIAWFPEYVSKASFQSLRDKWGANTVRLAMYTAEYNGYCTGGSKNKTIQKKKVMEGVKAATDLGMYVIIDWHVLNDRNPNKYKKEAIAFFKEMAQKYKNQKNVIYEICNEPNGNVSWAQVKSYAQDVIKEIRKIDKNAIILVGTPTWSQDVDIAAKSPIKGYSNIMYTCHFYAATHKASYRKKLETAVNAGLPVFVSEFSICEASGNGGVNKTEANKWMSLLNKYNISYVAWSLSNKNETCSLLKSSCNKKSGWTANDLSETGKWLVTTMKGSLVKGGTSGDSQADKKPSTTKPSTTKPSTAKPSKTKSVKASKKYCTVSVKKDGSWKSGKRYYTLYRVTLKNKSKYNISNWKLSIKFKYAVKKSDKWCGNFSFKNKTVTISPLSWNKTIAPNGKVDSVGFIVSSTRKNNKVSSVTFK